MTSLGTLQKGNTKTLNERKNIQIPLHTRRKQTTKALMIIFKSLILIKWSFICIQIIWKFGVLSVMILINNKRNIKSLALTKFLLNNEYFDFDACLDACSLPR